MDSLTPSFLIIIIILQQQQQHLTHLQITQFINLHEEEEEIR